MTSKEHLYCERLCAAFTCVMEPPGLAEEMRGGGSGIWRGRTAAILSCCCRVGANAERGKLKKYIVSIRFKIKFNLLTILFTLLDKIGE